MNSGSKILKCNCASCSTPINVPWENGVITNDTFVLVADWVYCIPCWDKLEAQMAKEPCSAPDGTFPFDVEDAT